MLFDDFWKELKNRVSKLKRIFLALERSYMIRDHKCKSIWKFSMHLLRLICKEKPAIIEKLLNSIKVLIEKERKTNPIKESQQILHSGIEILMELDQYVNPFEEMLSLYTKIFYENESKAEVAKNDIKGYINYINKRIKDEHERVVAYLDLSTGPKLQLILEKTLIWTHIDILIGCGFNTLIDENAVPELKALYEIIRDINYMEELKKSWMNYLCEKGLSILELKKNSEEIVEDLITFKINMDNILTMSFESDKNFKLTLKSSFEKFLNNNANKSAEYVAKYLDMYLNSDALKKIKKRSEDEIKLVIDRCIPLFRYILNKDIFEAFYLRRLCKRLLFSKSVSSEREKYLLDKLRDECGSNYTRKAEAMFQDMEVTKEMSQGFEQFLNNKTVPMGDMQFSAAILTLGSWPFESFLPIPLPKQVLNTFIIDFDNARIFFRILWCRKFREATSLECSVQFCYFIWNVI